MGFFFFLNEKSGGASWWRVCYQRGLPRLVFWFVQHVAELPSLSESLEISPLVDFACVVL